VSDEMTGRIHTVLGTIPSADLGITLPHEHVLIALTNWHMESDADWAEQPVSLDNLAHVRRRPYENIDNLILSNIEMQKAEVELFRGAGGNSIVDLSLEAIGRDVRGLAEVSRATGVNIVAGCGYYVHTAHPPEMDQMTASEIADVVVRDLTEGIDGTNIKAGVIGEIGTWDPIQPNEEKVLRGVAEAHRKTGAPIIVHTYLFAKWGMRVLDILEQEGVPCDRVALAHVDSILSDLDYHRAMADRGAYIEYDLFGAEGGNDDWRDLERGTRLIPPIPCDMERISAVKQLIDAGYGDRLLASQDICMKVSLTSFGGYGYAHILQNVVPLMQDLGIADSAIRDLVEVNPQTFLGWTSPLA
jgi:phosphotriesterase-related protein